MVMTTVVDDDRSDLAAVWQSILDKVPEGAVAWWNQWALVTAVGILLLGCAAVGLRVGGAIRARRNRHRVVFKPSSKFDPSAEEVLRFCGQLSRVHGATAKLTVPKSTRTIRIQLTSAGEGRMAQLLEGPASAEQILRHRGFAQVELADPDKVLPGGSDEAEHPPQSTASTDQSDDSDTSTPSAEPSDRSNEFHSDSDNDHLDPLDDEHQSYLDSFDDVDALDSGELMHPAQSRLQPVPARSTWLCLDDEDQQ